VLIVPPEPDEPPGLDEPGTLTPCPPLVPGLLPPGDDEPWLVEPGIVCPGMVCPLLEAPAEPGDVPPGEDEPGDELPGWLLLVPFCPVEEPLTELVVGVFVGFGVAVGLGVLVGFGVLVGLGVFVGRGVLVGFALALDAAFGFASANRDDQPATTSATAAATSFNTLRRDCVPATGRS
jgi:hypothetical protein